MPKSKRDRTVSLTVTKKKGLEFKQSLITEIRESLDTYDNLYLISIFNQRNQFLKDLRQHWSDSKFLFGKNKVISLAMGRGPESEYKENVHKIVPFIVGNIGLLFTNKTKEEVLKYFEEYSCPDFARSGNIATEDVTIPAGPLEQFQHTMEPQLRKLGLHTSLKRGIVTLDSDFEVCKRGTKLTPEQAQVLKLFDYMQASFKVKVKTYWNKSGEYELIDTSVEEREDESQDDDDDEMEAEVDAQEEEEEKELPKAKKLNKNNTNKKSKKQNDED